MLFEISRLDFLGFNFVISGVRIIKNVFFYRIEMLENVIKLCVRFLEVFIFVIYDI